MLESLPRDHSQISYYRDSNRNEIDLVLQRGSQTTLCEIKSGATFNVGWISTIDRLAAQFGENVVKEIVYGGDTAQSRSSFTIWSWRDI